MPLVGRLRAQFDTRHGKFVLFSTASRPDLGPTHLLGTEGSAKSTYINVHQYEVHIFFTFRLYAITHLTSYCRRKYISCIIIQMYYLKVGAGIAWTV
jgi:hypothetical protein